MRKLKGKRPSPAMVVAMAALVVSLGGTSIAQVATSALDRGDKRQVKRIAKRIANKRVRPALNRANAANANANTRLRSVITVNGNLDGDPPNSTNAKASTANCPPGSVVTGGGHQISSGTLLATEGIKISLSMPDGNGWTVGAHEAPATGSTWSLRAFARCALP